MFWQLTVDSWVWKPRNTSGYLIGLHTHTTWHLGRFGWIICCQVSSDPTDPLAPRLVPHSYIIHSWELHWEQQVSTSVLYILPEMHIHKSMQNGWRCDLCGTHIVYFCLLALHYVLHLESTTVRSPYWLFIERHPPLCIRGTFITMILIPRSYQEHG